MQHLSVVIAQKDQAAASQLATTLRGRFRHVAVAHSSKEIHDAILKNRANAAIVDLELLQSDEFRIRAQVLSPSEIIQSATLVGAEVLGMTGKLGRLAPDAIADVLVVDGDPLKSVDCLLGQGDHIPLVMKDGHIHFNELERG